MHLGQRAPEQPLGAQKTLWKPYKKHTQKLWNWVSHGKSTLNGHCQYIFLYVYQRLKSRWELWLCRVIFAKFILGLTPERVDEAPAWNIYPLVIQHSHGKWPIYRWFSHYNLHLCGIFHGYVKLPDGISIFPFPRPKMNQKKCLKTTSQKLIETVDALKKGTVFLWISHWPKIQQW